MGSNQRKKVWRETPGKLAQHNDYCDLVIMQGDHEGFILFLHALVYFNDIQ